MPHPRPYSAFMFLLSFPLSSAAERGLLTDVSLKEGREGQHKLPPPLHLYLPLSLLWVGDEVREVGQDYSQYAPSHHQERPPSLAQSPNKNGIGLNVMTQPSVE